MNFQNAAYLFLAMLLFAAVHSLTAGRGMKNLLAKVLGNAAAAGWYRLFYNLLSVLTVLPIAALMLWLPDAELYRVSAPISWVMRTLQVVSVVGALIALVSTDFWHFVGLSQAVRYLSGQSAGLASEQLTVTGLYRFMRHPLYFFSLTFLWLSPHSTWNWFSFNIAATLYFIIGSLFEERRLERTYGAAYREYRKAIPWLLPIRIPSRQSKRIADQVLK